MRTSAAHDDTPAERIGIPEPTEIEHHKGSSFGELIDIEEGRRSVSAYATKVPLENWAGPVAGSSALHERGIARSTLHDWQKRGQVVALLAGARKHVFPLEQFVDGRPLEGIAQIVAIAPSPRSAWLWSVQPSPLLGGKRPIDVLKQDCVEGVMKVLQTVFAHP